MVTEALTSRKTAFEGTENDAQISFVSDHFWLHFLRLELTFNVIQFLKCTLINDLCTRFVINHKAKIIFESWACKICTSRPRGRLMQPHGLVEITSFLLYNTVR